MNSGQAQASHADHSMISSIKGKQKSKGAIASSLVGSLFALIPGAATAKPGFKVTMQKIMDGKLMPGTRLTRMPLGSGKGSAKGFNILKAEPGITAARSSGLTDPHVLEFSEATRGSPVHQHTKVIGEQVPNSAAKGVRDGAGFAKTGVRSGIASKTANQPNGSVAGSNTPGKSSEGLLASNLSRHHLSQDGSPSLKGMPVSKEGTNGVQDVGEANNAGANVNGSHAKTAESTNLNSGVLKSSPEKSLRSTKLKGTSRRVLVSRTGDFSGKEKPNGIPGAGNNRVASLSDEISQPSTPARQVQRSYPGMKSAHANSRGTYLSEDKQSQLDGSLKQASSEHQISGLGYRRRPTAPGFTLGELPKAGIGSSSAKKAGKSRVLNQQGLEINHASPGNEGRLSKMRPVPDYPGSGGSHGNQGGTPKAVHAGGAARQVPSTAVEPVGGAGSNNIYSLTDQNVSRDMMMGNDFPNRGFVKPVMVGIPDITRNRKPIGKEVSSLMGQSLLSPTQSTNEVSALGSLARLTASQYFRFINSEQPNSVFTFHGGSLGNVRLSFSETDSGTVLHIVVESSEIRQVIQRTLPSLERDWIQEGLEFSDVNVEVGDTGYQWDSPGMEDQTRIPTLQESAETLPVSPEIIEQAIKDYGYNTLEFVA